MREMEDKKLRDGIKEKDIRDFVKYANKLDEVIKRIQKYNPEGHIYVNEDNFCLRGNYESKDNIEEVWIRGTDCGGEG